MFKTTQQRSGTADASQHQPLGSKPRARGVRHGGPAHAACTAAPQRTQHAAQQLQQLLLPVGGAHAALDLCPVRQGLSRDETFRFILPMRHIVGETLTSPSAPPPQLRAYLSAPPRGPKGKRRQPRPAPRPSQHWAARHALVHSPPPTLSSHHAHKSTIRAPPLSSHLYTHKVGGDAQHKPHLAALIHLQRNLQGGSKGGRGMGAAQCAELPLGAGAAPWQRPQRVYARGPWQRNTQPTVSVLEQQRRAGVATHDPPVSCSCRQPECRAARAGCQSRVPTRLPCKWSAHCPGCK